MCSTEDVGDNLGNIEMLASNAVKSGAQFISFPENALYFQIDLEAPRKTAFTHDSIHIQRLAKLAKSLGVVLHIGSAPWSHEGKTYNMTLVIDENGKVHSPYAKMHLFDIALSGQRPIRESEHFCRGLGPSTFTAGGFRFGLTIYYDIRFAELFSYYAVHDVQAILVPSAFLVETGKAHWEVLLRARAIETQSYVIAAAQGGRHLGPGGKVRETYGHSMIIDPWGRILAEVENVPSSSGQTIIADISVEEIRRVRAQMPLSSHRRLKTNWSWT